MKPHLALLALLLLAATACSNELQTCNTDDDCFAGEACGADNRCRKRVAATDMSAPDLVNTPDSAPDLPDLLDLPDQPLPDMSTSDLDIADMSAPDQSLPDPCQGITCSGHGSCEVSGDDGAICLCDPGYLARGATCALAGQLILGAGYRHSCAIRLGALYCWGDNTSGQRGATGAANVPKAVAPFAQETDALALGAHHTCAIQRGALYCWGDNTHSQLGIGVNSTTGEPSRFEPIAVEGMSAATSAVSAGEKHTCAIKNNALHCWGDGSQGQLGLGQLDPQHTPQVIPSLTTGVSAVAAGANHTCAIQSGVLSCWGDNSSGQTGQDMMATIVTAPEVVALSDVTAVASGAYHTCALAQGRLSCWGDNSHGQLGAASAAQPHMPVTPTGMESGVTAFATGRFHTCAIKNNTLYCWGANDHKQVDGDAAATHNSPIQVSKITTGASVIAITAGAYHTCAGLNDITIQCWGDNTSQQLAAGTFMLP